MPEAQQERGAIVGVARGHLALQLALTGIAVSRPVSRAEVDALIDEALDSDAAVLVIEEGLREEVGDALRRRLQRHQGRPLVVYCPAFESENDEVDAYLAAVIRPAIGYEIRF